MSANQDSDLGRTLASLLAAVGRLDQRVAVLEARSAPTFVDHPSAERLGVGEANTDFAGDYGGGKICDLEPGAKPCDHCSMCNSRGF